MSDTARKSKPAKISIVVNFICKNDKDRLSKAASLLAKGALNSSVEK